MPAAIIIGASSGIGLALARVYAANGYALGIAARREDKLRALAAALDARVVVKKLDVTKHEEALEAFDELLEALGDVDVIVLSSGVGTFNKHLKWKHEKSTIDVNVAGFTLLADAAFHYLAGRSGGHLAGLSSVAAIRGNSLAPAYNASKAYVSNYLEGLRKKARRMKLDLKITDVRPGFIKTPMTAENDNMFWIAGVDVASEQIYRAISSGRSVAYVTRRWRLVAWLLKALPGAIYERLPF